MDHAYDAAEAVPQILLDLVDPDLRVRSKALSRLHHVVHHQNTLYTATAPAALYVAGILSSLAPLLRDVLAVNALWRYREKAVDALERWGQDTTGLEVGRERYAPPGCQPRAETIDVGAEMHL